MGPWRLEAIRLWRTRRLIVLGATFLILGLGGPILAHYLPDIAAHSASDGVRISVPPPTPADGIAAYAQNIGQLGTLVVALAAGASLAIDARPGLAVFYRTRLRRPASLVLPRYLAVTGAAVAALALGTLGAWYETAVLIGPLHPAQLAAGFGLETLWLCFATAVVAALASVLRGGLSAAGWALALLIGLAALGGLPALSSWVPARLASSLASVTGAHPPVLWHAAMVAGLVTPVLLSVAVVRLGRREP
ncbi:MAG TPA: hypothetical protein VGI64_10705 [Streptosporangiaceae bacterium]|jgi:ABC-2 type transport system permease protein